MSVALGACSIGKGSKPEATTSVVPPSVTTEQNDPGDIPDNQVFVPYSPPPGGGYTVKVPEGWGRTEADGAVVFTDKLNSIRIESVPAAAAPTVASVRADEAPGVKAASPNYDPGKLSLVKRKAGMAVLLTYRGDGQPNEVTGKAIRLDVERYEFWRNGTEVILTLSGPKGADNVDPWKIVTDSFTWG